MENTTMTLQFDDKSLIPIVRKLIGSMNGVHVVPTKRKRKSGLELALEDEAAGRVTKWESAEQMFKTLMAE